MRKAQYGFGWDWGPRLPTIGIWRPVELRRERVADAHARELLDARDRARGAGGGRRRGRALRRRRPAGRARSSCARRAAASRPRATVTLRDGRGDRLPRARGPAAVVDARPRRARAARPAGDAEHGRRGRRRARAPRRGAHARARPAARPRRARHALLPLRAQRRRHLRPRRELDPGGLVRRRARVGALRAADRGRGRREHEHAARLGRRHLRARRLLRRVRPPRPARVAGLHVLLRDLPRGGAGRGGRPRGARAGRAAGRASVPRAVVRQQREPVDPRHAVPRPRRRPRAGRAVLRRDPPARVRGARPAHAVLAGLAVRRQRPQRARGGRRAQLGGLARPVAAALRRPGEQRPDARVGRLHPLRRGRGALHLRVRRARRARPRDAAALDPRRPAVAPQPGDGPPHEGQPEEQDRHAARVGHRRRRRPRRVRRLLDDRPGRGAEVRHRALPPPRAALLGHAGVAAQRLLAGAELGAARLPRVRQGGLLRGQARVRAGARLVQGRRRAVGDERHRRAAPTDVARVRLGDLRRRGARGRARFRSSVDAAHQPLRRPLRARGRARPRT